jgi:nesprin-1
MERVSRHGQLICQRTRDENEQHLVSTTLSNLSEQLQQVRSWLEEKKLQVGDSIDAWQRFLQMHSLVVAWVEEKKTFLAEPLHLTSLVQARQKSQDYNVIISKSKDTKITDFSTNKFGYVYYFFFLLNGRWL